MTQNFEIRELELSDIPLICDYWLNADSDFLKGMGVDLSKLPSREGLTAMLTGQVAKPNREKQSYALIGVLNGTPIGHCNVNPFEFGKTATMHLHVWNSNNRRKGIGEELVRLSVEQFFKELEVAEIYSEPYAENPAPNRTLKKCGFTLLKTYTTVPGSLNFEQEVNRWVIKKADWLK